MQLYMYLHVLCRLAVALKFYGSTSEAFFAGDLLGFSPATVHNYIDIVSAAIIKRLLPLHVRLPNDQQVRNLALQFKNLRPGQHPYCIGALDGKLFRVP